MRSEMEDIRKHLVKSLQGGQAYESLEEALNAVPHHHRFDTPPGAERSPWQIVDHMRFTLEDLVSFSDNQDGSYREMNWPEDYWPKSPAPVPPETWESTLAKLEAARSRMISLIEDPNRDLLAPFPWGTGQTLLREALLAIEHNGYHVGELIQLTRWIPTTSFGDR